MPVLLEFWLPKFQLRLRPPRQLASLSMAVPKTSVNENDLVAAWEHQIGVPGQIFVMEFVTVPHSMDETSYQHLRLRVFRANPAHPFASLDRSQGVHCSASNVP